VRIVYWLVTGLVAAVCMDFAYVNRGAVTVSLWPVFEFDTSVYLVVLLALLVGFLIGLLVAWLWSLGPRRTARVRARRIEILERDLAEAEQRAKGTSVIAPHS
jgi:uncharacterized integral membrane protein